MAIVGTAYIKIKAITTDFQKEADRAYEKFFRLVTTSYAIGPAIATAVGGISSMVSGLVALGSQIAAALPALIVLPSMFSAIGQAAIAAKMAFSGIGGAMKALTKKGGGGGDNSKRIEQAEKRLAQVLESNREALVRANDRLTEAEKRLTKARKEAAESLQQLNFDAEDAALSEKKAAIELEKARETLARVQDLPPNSRARREAELAYQEADLNMRRAKDRNADLAKETEKRNKLGVEGSEEVVDAAKQVQEAVDARAKAELEALRALTEAQEALNDARKGSGGGGADKEALSKLSKEARAFAEYLVSIQPELVKLRHAAGRELFGPMTFALDNIVKNLFPALEPILQKTGAALGKTALDFSNIVTENENLKELAIVADTNSDSIGKLGTIFGNLYDVMLSLLTAADPLVRRFTDWLVTLTTGWKETRELKNQTGELRDMFNRAGDIAAQLGRALGKNGLFGAIMNIGRAASGPGSGGEMLLDTFEKSMKKFDEFTEKMLKDGSLGEFFMKASENFSKISTLLVNLTKEFLKLGDDAAIGETAESLAGDTVVLIGEIFTILQEAGPYLADFITKLAKFLRIFTESQSIKFFFGTLELGLDVLIAIFSNPIVQKVTLFTVAVLGAGKALHLMGKLGKFAFLLVTKYMRIVQSSAAYAQKAFAALKFAIFQVQYYFVTLSTPVLVTVAAIAALVAIFVLAYANSEKLREALKELYEKVLAKVVEVFNEVKGAIEEVIGSFGSAEGVGETFKNIFKTIGDFIATYFVPILENTLMPILDAVGNVFKGIIYIIGAVIKVFQGIYEFIRGVFSLITGDVDGAKEHFGKSFGAIADAFKFAFKAIKQVFLAVWNVIRAGIAPLLPIFKVAFGVIKSIVEGVWNGIKFVFNVVWGGIKLYIEALKTVFKTVFDVIKTVVNGVWEGIKFAFDVVWGGIKLYIEGLKVIFETVFDVIETVVNGVWEGIKVAFDFVWGQLQNTIEGFKIIVETVMGVVSTVFSTAWDGIKAAFDFVWGGITGAIQGLTSIFTSVFNAIKGVVSGVFDGLSSAFTGAINAVLSAIESGINFAIRGLNTILDGIDAAAGPWVNFGEIPEVKLPRVGGGGGKAGGKSRAVTEADVSMYRARLALGGIVSPTPGGTLAVIGEAGRPERVEPLDPDGLSRRDKEMIKFLSGGVQGGVTMNIYPSEGMSETELASKISRELAFQLRRGAA